MADEIISPPARSTFDYNKPRSCKKCGVTFSGRGCKECKNAAKRARRKNNPGKERGRAAVYREKNRERIRMAAVTYRAKNPDSVKLAQKTYYENNAIDIKTKLRIYRAENRDRLLKHACEYSIKNKHKKRIAAKKYRDKYPDRVKAQFNAWAAANPEANRVRSQNRRARRIANGGVLSKDIIEKLLVLQKGKCACCGKKLGDDYHLDHIIPLAKGGSNSDSNMQLLKSFCNLQKHAKDPIDFMQERGFLL